MTNDGLLKIEEVAILIGCSVNTINNWYRYKKQNPNEEISQSLPDFIQEQERQTRYWKKEDIYKLIEFQSKLPRGRNGLLGTVTQKYYKKEKKKNGKKKTK